jgi:outer membrane protein assembly factor BamB
LGYEATARAPWVSSLGVSIPTGTAYVVAFDFASGTLVWEKPLHKHSGGGYCSAQLCESGIVYTSPNTPEHQADGTWLHVIYGLDAADGSVRRIVRTGEHLGMDNYERGGFSPLVKGDHIYQILAPGAYGGGPQGDGKLRKYKSMLA